MIKKFIINFEIKMPDTYLVDSIKDIQAKELIAEKLQEIVGEDCKAKISVKIVR